MKRLALLDYGRFFAAIMVVFYHYTFNGIANGKITSIKHMESVIDFSKYGYLGVELFFMISGYVIFFSACSGNASTFAVSRAVRLYPAYWFAVLFTSFVALQWGGDLMSVKPSQILFNLTMMQSYFGIAPVDGVYWTLAFEMLFYSAVLLLLLCGLQKHLQTIFTYWPILLLISLLLGIQSWPYLGGYYCYFSAGALFAILKQNFRFRAALSLLLVFALCIFFSTSKATQIATEKGIHLSPVVIILLISAFFLLFIVQNTKKGQLLNLPMSKTFGALTYPIYLIHAHFGYMFISKFATEDNKVFIYALTFSIVVAIAIFIHKIIEQKLSGFWKKVFGNSIGRLVSFIQELLLKMQRAYTLSFRRAPSGG